MPASPGRRYRLEHPDLPGLTVSIDYDRLRDDPGQAIDDAYAELARIADSGGANVHRPSNSGPPTVPGFTGGHSPQGALASGG